MNYTNDDEYDLIPNVPQEADAFGLITGAEYTCGNGECNCIFRFFGPGIAVFDSEDGSTVDIQRTGFFSVVSSDDLPVNTTLPMPLELMTGLVRR